MAALTGGDRLEKVLAQIAENAKGSVKVGFLAGATYPDGTPVAQVAFWNEFGHGGRFPSPPRPFFRTMVANDSPGWAVRLGRALTYFDMDAQKALSAMGESIAGELRESIINISGPELSPTTLVLRQRFWTNPQDIRFSDVLAAQRDAAEGAEGAGGTQAKPLVWTGHMLNSIDYEVGQ